MGSKGAPSNYLPGGSDDGTGVNGSGALIGGMAASGTSSSEDFSAEPM